MKYNFKNTVIAVLFATVPPGFIHAQEIFEAGNKLKQSAQKMLATYFGGSGTEFCEAIALDEEGNVYVTGYTGSANFPTTAGTYNATPKGKTDVFVMKFDRDLKTILASTLIGGVEDECGYSMLFGQTGFLYIAGYTGSSDFPVTESAFCSKYVGGEGDAFVLKMNKDLTTLIASTFLGGSGTENDWRSPEIVQDDEGNVYISGITNSVDFPTTKGVHSETYNGGEMEVFLSKFDPNLENLLASTFLGGNGDDRLSRSLSIDKMKNQICIGGYTFSPNFPVTPNAYSSTVRGQLDGFVAKFSMDLTELTASTILPSGWIYCMVIHENGDIYVGGHTRKGLPTTQESYYPAFDKHTDQGFISRFSNDLTRLKSSTILPGTGTPGYGGDICPLSITQGLNGEIITAGWVRPADFPTTPGAFDETQNEGSDLFILEMNPDLSELLASTFVGGSNRERWSRMIPDKNRNLYVASYTLSADFPTTKGSASEQYNGGDTDGFVVRMDKSLAAEPFEEFHDAAKRDNLKKVKRMLSKDSSLLEKTDKYQRTALHSAARYGAISVCGYLIQKGADLNARDESENTPLHLASLYSHDAEAGLLIDANADFHLLNKDGLSPLSIAVTYGTPETVRLLLSHGADPGITDGEGNTLLHIAALRAKAEKADELLKVKPEVDQKNNAGNTPLLAAVGIADNEGVIRSLLDHGADLSVPDSTGKSVLHLASTSNIKILMENGVDVTCQDRNGNTALHSVLLDVIRFKVFFPFKDKIRLLMEYGADPAMKNKAGKSAMDLAEESGEKEAVELLKNKK